MFLRSMYVRHHKHNLPHNIDTLNSRSDAGTVSLTVGPMVGYSGRTAFQIGPTLNHSLFQRSVLVERLWCVWSHKVLVRAQQTRGIGPMFGWCWPIVYDAGPTSAQHWANTSCLLGSQIYVGLASQTLAQYIANVTHEDCFGWQINLMGFRSSRSWFAR